MRVLIADDHPLFRAGLAGLLKTRGIDVIGEAGTGLEALEQTRRLKPDLVLMDVNMPHVNGLEATRLIKTELPETKIVILTVSDEDEHVFEAIKSGAQGYLLKNLEPQAFFDLIEGVAVGEAPISRGLATKILGEFARHLQGDAGQAATKDNLTQREKEVLRLVAEGLTNRNIAPRLNVTENTVKYHLKNIMEKLHLRNRAQAAAYAVKTGLVKKA